MATDTTSGWHASVDKIVMISLRNAVGQERRARSIPELERSGIPRERIELYLTDRHPEGGRKGCFHSHMTVLERFVKENSNKENNKNIAVFEDDVRISPTGFRQAVMEQVARFVRSQDFDVLYLGFLPVWPTTFLTAPFADRDIVRYDDAILTHAVIYSLRGARRIVGPARRHYLTHDGNNITHYDHFLRSFAPESLARFCAVPMQFDQFLCMPTTNLPADTKERVARALMMCPAEKLNLIELVSRARQHAFYAIALLVMLAALLGSFVAFVMRAAGRGGARRNSQRIQ